MKKIFAGIFLAAILAGISMLEKVRRDAEKSIFEISILAKKANFDEKIWREILAKNAELPRIFPISKIKNSLAEIEKIFDAKKNAEKIFKNFLTENSREISVEKVEKILAEMEKIRGSIFKIEKNLKKIPAIFLSKKQILARKKILQKIKFWRENFANWPILQKIFREQCAQNSRAAILLQNQNEPRPTGGFVGSILILDFSREKILWKFSDIYEIDRKISAEKKIAAPDFFKNLSKKISLRDANFWPNFPDSAAQIRDFFAAAGEKKPDTILAINLNLAREILRISGPIEIKKWGAKFDEKNFDVILQFLVEAKIAGRFAVKKPILDFISAVFAKFKNPKILKNLPNFDAENFFKNKNFLANSENSALQKLFEKWKIDGKIQQKNAADNFLFFDFVSIGANKSEKFLWTKIWHDAKIFRDGRTENSLEISRAHHGKKSEILDLLHFNSLSKNLQNLLDDKIFWKLGLGENRTVLRIFAPIDAKILSQKNPSGKISEKISDDQKFKIFEIPAFVAPGENLKIFLKYETKISRGSKNWRPYFLQLVGTPGREKTTFLATISTEKLGRFSAETKNIGRPQNLRDDDFRAVIEFSPNF